MAVEAVLKAWEACSKTDTAFILVCSVFCWPIIPAVGLGYSGYSTRRSGLASFMPAILSVAVCSIQWFVIGYTLAYGEGGQVFGSLSNAFHIGVLAEPVGTIPAILFSEFQLIFEATVCAIAVGGACERGRLLPIIPFIVVCYLSQTCPFSSDKHSSFGRPSSTAHWHTWYGAEVSWQNLVLSTSQAALLFTYAQGPPPQL